MNQVHLIGIGGSGLSAIAVVLLERGFKVTGSDRQLSPMAEKVRQAGGQVMIGHRPENVRGASLVLCSSAIDDQNPEVQAARAAGIPILKRADFLPQLTGGSRVIAVAGTHGKTTTTAMIAWMLVRMGLDPSYIIGGVSLNLGANAHAGLRPGSGAGAAGNHFVIEADEYDRMFLGLSPEIALVTNIEYDHPDCYPTPDDFYQAFADFASRVVPGGCLLVCGEDAGAARLGRAALCGAPSVSGAVDVLTYGIGSQSFTYNAQVMQPNSKGGYTFLASGLRPGQPARAIQVALSVPGKHNVRNAQGALAVADLLGLPWEQAAEALDDFQGTGRRFEIRGRAAGVIVIDDYAHHPTELKATLAAARTRYPGQSIWAVWQPHTYSRTRALAGDFATAFGSPAYSDVDHVLVTEIYPAREAPPADGYSARLVVENMPHPDAHFTPTLDDALGYLLANVGSGDIVLVLSAGDADWISSQLLMNLSPPGGRSLTADERG